MAIKKIIKSKTPESETGYQVRFEPELFNGLIFDKGYDVWHDQALRCPCSVENSGQSLPNCNNCLGIGWIFINRAETRIAIQGMKANVQFDNWTEKTAGMAKVTSRAIDKLAFMDRIILRDVEGYFNEILRTRTQNGVKVIFTIYDVISVESLFMFVSAKLPLKQLYEGVDYTIDRDFRTMITLSNALSATPAESLTLTIRYRHYQTYHIIDMNRDIVKVRTKDVLLPGEQLKEMPIMGMARKSHYLFDNAKYDENQRLIENT